MKPDLMTRATRSNGFSLVELMVAMVLGLLLLAGVVSAFIANRQVYRTNENMSRLQETARIVNELMGRDIRAAGGNPCGTPLVTNVLKNAANNWWSDWNNGALVGYEGTQATTFKPFGSNTADRVLNTDAILILTGTSQEGLTIASHNPPAAQFQLNTVNHGINDGDVLMVCDPSSAAIFQVTNAQPGTNSNVVHNTGATATPGNCTKYLGYPGPATCDGSTGPLAGTSKDFTGGVLVKFNPVFWYIGINPNGGTSLYRMVVTGNSTSSPPSVTATTEEIVEGVIDMQLQYLTRNTTSNTLATSYVDANNVTDWSNGSNPLVVAVRATLTLQTLDNVATSSSQPISRTLSFTTSIRNREVVQ